MPDLGTATFTFSIRVHTPGTYNVPIQMSKAGLDSGNKNEADQSDIIVKSPAVTAGYTFFIQILSGPVFRLARVTVFWML